MTDLPPALVYVALAGMGLIVGSFLNVVIYRVPLGMSIVRPGSACPRCGAAIRPSDNIPVVSWLVLRGRCRACGAPISARYPLVELANAVLWVLLLWWCWSVGQVALLPLLLVLGSAGLALAMIDVDHHRLPDPIVLMLYPVTLAGLILAGLVSGQWPWMGLLVGLVVWVVLIGGLWLLSGGRAMGFGDVKLAPVLGGTLGWVVPGAAVIGLFAAFLLGGGYGLLLIARRRAGRASRIPFGPFLLAGALIGLIWGPALWSAYLGSMGL